MRRKAQASLDLFRNSTEAGQQRHGEEADEPKTHRDDSHEAEERADTLDPPPAAVTGIEKYCVVVHGYEWTII